MTGLGVYQELALGIALISSGAALVAESLCRGQGKRRMPQSEIQIVVIDGNSGPNVFGRIQEDFPCVLVGR